MRGLLVCGALLGALAIPAAAEAQRPWSDPALGPDQRADLVIDAMTLEEKAELMSTDTGTAWAYFHDGIPRLGVPSLRMLDAGAGPAPRRGRAAGHGEPRDRDAIAAAARGVLRP
jgi:hypothetical protein